jgi:hypothetical protein
VRLALTHSTHRQHAARSTQHAGMKGRGRAPVARNTVVDVSVVVVVNVGIEGRLVVLGRGARSGAEGLRRAWALGRSGQALWNWMRLPPVSRLTITHDPVLTPIRDDQNVCP